MASSAAEYAERAERAEKILAQVEELRLLAAEAALGNSGVD